MHREWFARMSLSYCLFAFFLALSIAASSMHSPSDANDCENLECVTMSGQMLNASRCVLCVCVCVCVSHKEEKHQRATHVFAVCVDIVLATPAKPIYLVDLNCLGMLSEHPYICWQRLSDYFFFLPSHCWLAIVPCSAPFIWLRRSVVVIRRPSRQFSFTLILGSAGLLQPNNYFLPISYRRNGRKRKKKKRRNRTQKGRNWK